MAYKWFGFGTLPSERSGFFSTAGTPYANTYADTSKLFIRAWEGPSLNGNGTIPTNTVWYGNSALYSITKFSTGQPEAFEAGFDQPTWYAIPEVGTGAGVAFVMLTMAAYRRLRRWRE